MPDEKIDVTAVKGFLNQGTYARVGDVISVTELRARDLERNGLISREVAPPRKSAPPPRNKKAPEPNNKTATDAADHD